MVKLTKRYYELIKRALEKHGIDSQTVDIVALWDNQLSYQANKQHRLEHAGIKREVWDEDYKRHMEQEALRKVWEWTKGEFEKSIKEIAKHECRADNYFLELRDLIQVVAQGYEHALIVVSKGGLGKTYVTLKELGRNGNDFVYYNTYTTPLELYEFLYANANDKLIVLDDVEGILTDRKSISILKSALWGINGKRIISYFSNTPMLKAPQQFMFNSRIIMLFNQFPLNGRFKPIMEALKTRCLYYEINFGYFTKLKILFEIAKLPYKGLGEEER